MQETLDLIVVKQGAKVNNDLIESGEVRVSSEGIVYLVINS